MILQLSSEHQAIEDDKHGFQNHYKLTRDNHHIFLS